MYTYTNNQSHFHSAVRSDNFTQDSDVIFDYNYWVLINIRNDFEHESVGLVCELFNPLNYHYKNAMSI